MITLLCILMWSCDWINQQDSKKIKRSLEEEQRARKDLERTVRKVLKNMNDQSWDETNLWDHEKFSYRFGSICGDLKFYFSHDLETNSDINIDEHSWLLILELVHLHVFEETDMQMVHNMEVLVARGL